MYLLRLRATAGCTSPHHVLKMNAVFMRTLAFAVLTEPKLLLFLSKADALSAQPALPQAAQLLTMVHRP